MIEKKRTPAVAPSTAPALSAITERIVTMLREKDAAGVAEYHDTVDRTDFTAAQWLDHLLSELLDASKYLEAMRGSIIRGDQAASLLAGIGWAWNGDLWQPPAEEAASQSTPAAAQEAVVWSKTKPTIPGAYWVRGWNLDNGKQLEQALTTVALIDGELCSDLNERNTDRHRDWMLIEQHSEDFEWHGPLYAAPVAAAPAEMSPEFTDTARAAIAWVLYHHQGGSSPVGQPLRFALGMGAHDPLPDWRIAEAKRYAEWAGATTAKFHEARAGTPAAPGIDLAADHDGMRVHYRGLLKQVRDGLHSESGLVEMLLQLQGHLSELGRRWYVGDRKVVDEFLQLYCIEVDARRALIDASPKGDDVQDARFLGGLPDAIAYADAMEEVAGALYQQVFGHESDGSDTGTDMLTAVLRKLEGNTNGGSEANTGHWTPVEILEATDTLRMQANSHSAGVSE